MEIKFWAVVNWGVLVIVTLLVAWMVWGFSFGGTSPGENASLSIEKCVDVEKLEGLSYDACYDAYAETIFLKASRENSNYRIDSFEISFVDLSSQSHVLDEVPGAGEDVAYRIQANKNPKSIKVGLDVFHDFSGDVCAPSGVFVEYCPTVGSVDGVNVSISPIGGVSFTDYIEVSDFDVAGSDVVAMDLVEKEAIWESTCKSDWDCGNWEACEEGFQRRDCQDSNNCQIPTNSPVTVQSCDGFCVEKWECEWSSCSGGFSVPTCNDISGCGTKYDVPEKLPCDSRETCSPKISCGEWSKCDVDYDFIDLVGSEDITNIDGFKSRICVDNNGCVANQKEEASCSVGVDIYTKRFQRCGEEYVGVYNVLDDSTLAILKEGGSGNSYLNIYFDDQDSVYCDYCFDGVMNGDETGIDCGGSCRGCEKVVYEEKNWWDFLF